MNGHDIDFAISRFTRAAKPNRLALALVIDHLASWTDQNSDGWAYWTKPRQAAQRAIAAIESTTNAANDAQERTDISDDDLRAAVRPIKAFLTRHKVPADVRERILRAAEDVA